MQNDRAGTISVSIDLVRQRKETDVSVDPLFSMLLKKLAASWSAQPDKPEETPESTLKALCFAAAGNPVSVIRASQEKLPAMDGRSRSQLRTLIELRIAGVPLAHITGRQRFMGVELLAGPEALIPRVETEILGQAALTIAHAVAHDKGTVGVLDVCTGSGNIALGIASNEPRSRVFGADISEEAISLARQNVRLLHLEDRVDFRTGDLFAAFESEEYYTKMDLVTCNPPYISSAKTRSMDPEITQHEPRLAFDGGSLGITILSRLIRESPKFLKQHSYLCFEVGLGQGKAMEQRLRSMGCYRNIQLYLDASHEVRALSAQLASP
jgi:release factor glutamine methyltransferase